MLVKCLETYFEASFSYVYTWCFEVNLQLMDRPESKIIDVNIKYVFMIVKASNYYVLH